LVVLLFALLLTATLAGCTRQAAPEQPGDDDIVLNNRGVALMGHFDYAGALEVFADLIARNEGWHDARINLAIALMNRQESGDSDLALQQLVVVLEAQPENIRANYVTGLLRLYLGEVEAAAGRFANVLAVDPADAYAHYYLGQCQLRLDDKESALAAFQQTIKQDPYLRSAYYSAAQVMQQLGRSDEAREMFALFERLADNPRARLAEFKYTRMGPKSLAIATASEALVEETPVRPEGALFREPQIVGSLGAVIAQAHLTSVDLDNDGRQEVFMAGDTSNRLLAAASDARFVDHVQQPWSAVSGINAVAWGDIDNNGLVDAYLCRSGLNQLWLQVAANNWQQAGPDANVGDGDNDCADAALVDADHDGDLDILIGNRAAADNLLNNNRDGSFRSLTDQLGAAAEPRNTHRLITADIDGDRDVDLLFIHDAPPHVVLINDRLWNYTAASGLDEFLNTALRAAAVIDLDTDGRSEIVGIDDDGQIRAWQVGNDDQWQSRMLYRSQLAGEMPVDLATLDLSGDANLELAILARGAFEIIAVSRDLQGSHLALERFEGTVPIPVLRSASRGSSLVAAETSSEQTRVVEWRAGPGRFDFVTLTLSGMRDDADTMRSNASGIGTQVSLRNGSHWSLTDTYKHSSQRGHSLQPLAIGLRGKSRADFVALHWSDGVFQTELDIEGGSNQRIAETERQLSSCPVLFAWDGDHFEFVTDLLGVGGLGGFVEPGVVATPRPWERLALAPDTLASRNDRLIFKLTEPMQENAYVDAVHLESYDLPPDWHLLVDERMATGAPAITGETLFYRTSISPVAAFDSRGNDVLPLIADHDERAMSPGNIDHRFLGLLEKTESVTLEFDQHIERLNDHAEMFPVLLADAWVEYPYSQTAFSAWQAGLQYRSATLEARDGDGVWHMVYPEFGYPAGMPREMSLPLHELPPRTNALRISWNRELYWDRIRIVYAEPAPDDMQHAILKPLLTRVAKTGFAMRTTHEQRRPHYDYDQRVPFWDTEYATGFYTQLGNMTELVATADDAIAIIGPGEEIHLEFAAAAPPQAGLHRWYVLETRGWAKDKDLYTHQGETVEPLPRANPDTSDPDRDELHARFNNRFQAGQ
jgi:Flp pilus assembly protein TadD